MKLIRELPELEFLNGNSIIPKNFPTYKKI